MRTVSRRGFFKSSGAAIGALSMVRSIDVLAQAANPVFRHGVASGDPLADRVIIWTRVTPASAAGAPMVSWQMARDAKFTQIVGRGEQQTGAERDFTVKVDVAGLAPGTTYYYRFAAGKDASPIGRTRTLPPAGAAKARLAVASCANLPAGFFNAYATMARRNDLDAVLHLGDYFYEYANGTYGDGTALNRVPAPNREIVLLADYRERHAQYKADRDLQEVHRQHPFICVWDDHEFTNDTWSGGAQNHNPETGEGDWWTRRAAAARAYCEWMPIREDVQTLSPRIYRTFAFGDLASLYMLDTRLVGRSEQVSGDDVAALESPARSAIGAAQEHWLAEQFAASVRAGTRWNVLGQQIMFAPQTAPGQRSTSTDSWDGYRASRDRVFDLVEQLKVGNFTVLTGDVHSCWAYDLPRRPFAGYDKASGKGSLGVEFAGTSISSPSGLDGSPEGLKRLAAVRARPHLHYVEGRYRGYFTLDLTRERLQADFYSVPTVQERTTTEQFEKGFISESGRNHLVEVSKPAAPGRSADPAP